MGARKFALSSTVAWPRAPSGRLRSARTSKHETTCPGPTSTYSIPSRAGNVPQIAWLTSEAVLPARIGIDHLPAGSPRPAVELHAHRLSQGSACLTRDTSDAGLGIGPRVRFSPPDSFSPLSTIGTRSTLRPE